MKKKFVLVLVLFTIALISISFVQNNNSPEDHYIKQYTENLDQFYSYQKTLLASISTADLNSKKDVDKLREQIFLARIEMKKMDFWFRYMNPIDYKKINGPLPVEWETEVFEKFEKPYKREGAGLTLAYLYLDEETIEKDSLAKLIQESLEATGKYKSDSLMEQLKTYHHFFLSNRLFLLNLAAIYTTGFECPEKEKVVPELLTLLLEVEKIYRNFNQDFPETKLSEPYLKLYQETIQFVKSQPLDSDGFDHYSFLREYINPLFSLNQRFVLEYQVSSRSYVDYSLSKKATSIFDKSLYFGQNTKGVFLRVKDEKVLQEIERIGKLLFYDPILSGNNLRSCASCHKPTQYFTDTLGNSAVQFNRKDFLPRNTPSLINGEYNHLLMLDGKHTSLQNQGRDVITNPLEMGSKEVEMIKKMLSCSEYRVAFKQFLKYTPQEKEVTYEHIVSAVSLYYGKFSNANATFDRAMNRESDVTEQVKKGFNLFMGKAECATCHFVPQFNGVKPPYVNSEFEVLGVPQDQNYKNLSPDAGRFEINPAIETKNAFRTGSLRNIEHTKPYMHNGVFSDLNQVIDFYDAGGGAGRGLLVPNQTLSSDSLHLTEEEKKSLIVFLKSLQEDIPFEAPPSELPMSRIKMLNIRKVGGEY